MEFVRGNHRVVVGQLYARKVCIPVILLFAADNGELFEL